MKHANRMSIVGFLALAMVGCGSVSHAAAATGPFVYVADTKSNQVSEFSASPSDFGALKPLTPSTVSTGPFPYTIAVDPQGTSAYAVSWAHEVSQYTISPITGQLTPKSPATVATPPNPEPIAVSPNGKYAYVANCGGCGYALRKRRSAPAGSAGAKRESAKPSFLVAYRINHGTGALSSKPIATVATGNGANWVAIAPNSRSAYVATSTNGVWQYTINPTTGRLSPKKPETTGGTEHNIVIAPNGKNAYVIGDTSRGVSQYRINPRTGTLSSKRISAAATVLHPEAIAIAPNGESAYVTSENDGKVAQYTINPTTGKITPMSPATIVTASGSLGLAVTP